MYLLFFRYYNSLYTNPHPHPQKEGEGVIFNFVVYKKWLNRTFFFPAENIQNIFFSTHDAFDSHTYFLRNLTVNNSSGKNNVILSKNTQQKNE